MVTWPEHSVSEMIPADFLTPTASISGPFTEMNLQECMNNSNETN